jgi:DNA repair protein RecN (Recombination protein N)
MLSELRVRHLGVIDDQALVLGPGMTALTGETGAGKTLIVDAIELLLGGRADSVLVRLGAPEAVIEARFVVGTPGLDETQGLDGTQDLGGTQGLDETEGLDGTQDLGGMPARATSEVGAGPVVGAGPAEMILGRVVPAEGRSRAYLDGRMVSSGVLATAGAELVDLHGQHAHQSLLSAAAQRAALDLAAGIDHRPLDAARAALRRVTEAQAAIGGDQRAREREADLLHYQLDELDRAGLDDADEDQSLRAEEDRLGQAGAPRLALEALVDAVNADDGAGDRLRAALVLLGGLPALAELHERLLDAMAELSDVVMEAGRATDRFDDDPGRLAEIGARRHVLSDLRRKYGQTLPDVIAFRDEARRRLDEIGSHATRAAALAAEQAVAEAAVVAALRTVGSARRAAAGPMAAAIEARLVELALPRARFEIEVSDDPGGDTVTWLLGANPGEAALPLAKVASGGELARTMLAVRLVLGGLDTSPGPGPSIATGSPGGGSGSGSAPDPDRGRTLVFDEVDAGIGGEAAVAVGRALAALGRRHQVLVVTHLPQVAAFADHHLVVTKVVEDGRTLARVVAVASEDRVVELSRMLSGRPDSETARRHAAELLGQAEGDPAPARPRPARPGRDRARTAKR